MPGDAAQGGTHARDGARPLRRLAARNPEAMGGTARVWNSEPLVANVLIQIAISDSTVSGMTTVGIGAIPIGAASAVVSATHTHVTGNNFAFKADSTNGGATLVLDANTIEYNQQGVVAVGPSSTLYTRANNAAKINTFNDYSGMLTFVPAI
jgi:hypothetical protein